MDKHYQPQTVEPKINQFWEKGGYFTPKIDPQKKPFVITIPLPNVTGSLHAGHAMFVIEDVMTRFHRLKGEPTLWIPGFDHASIAVEYLVTKQLKKRGKNKNEVGREMFLREATKFANDSRNYIREQLKTLGFSLDWTREAYTLDPIRSKAVVEAFNRLYHQGLIYQGKQIVNWCPHCQTVLSDLENIHREEKGYLYYIKYGPITIATTRPETMFADVAIAIHPSNKKYQHLVGKTVPLPLTKRKIPVIIDEAVEPEFGTGALKITPAHDEVDFEIGQRHHLKALSVIDKNGQLNKLAGKYEKMKIKEAREKIVNDLKKAGLIEKIENINHSLGHCERCGTTTESIISQQWFVKTKSLAKKAIKAVKEDQIKIIPKHFEKIYFHWLSHIHDWCISRQLWWGHQIPVWYRQSKTKNRQNKEIFVGEKPKGSGWVQDQDVLDTWFSSSLWTMSTLGWPENTADFKHFYPTTVRETGYDILFFWVAREIMMCLELSGQIPFKTVYLHGLVRDEKGRKFSKTKSIGFDPLPITKQYGTDALRMALVYGNGAGNDIVLSIEKTKSMRNFANKIWNAARFIVMNRETLNPKSEIRNKFEIQSLKIQNKDDQQILKSLEKNTKSVTTHIENYRFGQAAEEIYQFFWHEFCDQYIEKVKNRRDEAQPTLIKVLKTSLILLHPFMPFISEEIWTNQLKEKTPLVITKWPKQRG